MLKYTHMNKDEYIHNKKTVSTDLIKEVIFGLEDGLVSTFGAILGVATATGDSKTIILTGAIVIVVESVSMGVGSFIASRSEQAINNRKLKEEKEEVENHIEYEQKEMEELFIIDGWPKDLAKKMAEVSAKDKDLMLTEMAYRELKIFPDLQTSPIKNGFTMWISYIIGGIVPLSFYLLLPINIAIWTSIVGTLITLFIVGALTTRFSKRSWVKAGAEMVALASLAATFGYVVGQLVY